MKNTAIQTLSQNDLKKQLARYRLMTLAPLLLGMVVTLFMIWLDRESETWLLIYFTLIIILLPLILKSRKLHIEWRRRKRVNEDLQRNR